MKRLLQSLQPPVPTAPTKTASVNESDFQPPHMIDLDALSMSASNSHFLDEELVDPALQSGPPQVALSSLSAAGGSSGCHRHRLTHATQAQSSGYVTTTVRNFKRHSDIE
ncbi:hypothetical protein G5714_016966 [Onychostoma macrolepis]|uniref:Uncharacterized protein n=1 Tax=Onychostoma macrolepis TaxID=369639 RepID=A0A7J6C4N7_9TELE|nr:hypothetical protein G5714_016966 [Onychostoma macrolepis]